MTPFDYLALRLIRRHLPDDVVRSLLRRRLIIKPGLETINPGKAIQRFLDAVAASGHRLEGKRILIFGYGGNFGVGVGLLKAGASHVVLLDPFARPDRRVNLELAQMSAPYLGFSGGEAVPHPDYLTVVHAPLADYLAAGGAPADIVFSNSVLEHVGDVEGTVPALARATAPGGQHFHFVDLRDHFFKHPFEMLCHSERVWRGVLNPGSNLNRLRIWDYERLFSATFPRVIVEPLDSDVNAFRKIRRRIRPEFLSGDEASDAATRAFLRASFA